MTYEATASYYDIELARNVDAGEQLDMTKERAAVINGAFPGYLVEVKKAKKEKR